MISMYRLSPLNWGNQKNSSKRKNIKLKACTKPVPPRCKSFYCIFRNRQSF